MYPKILSLIRDLIRERRYVVTLHAMDEMEDDSLTVFDVERVVLTGEILGRQKDKKTYEWKYLVHGTTIDDRGAEIVLKIGPTGSLVVITAYVVET